MARTIGQKQVRTLKLDSLATPPPAETGLVYFDSANSKLQVSTDGVSFGDISPPVDDASINLNGSDELQVAGLPGIITTAFSNPRIQKSDATYTAMVTLNTPVTRVANQTVTIVAHSGYGITSSNATGEIQIWNNTDSVEIAAATGQPDSGSEICGIAITGTFVIPTAGTTKQIQIRVRRNSGTGINNFTGMVAWCILS